MRVAVTGATGNVGTALLHRLLRDGHDVLGISSRSPGGDPPFDSIEHLSLDLTDPAAADVLAARLAGVEAVVHLAWLIQPAHDRERLRSVNQGGTAAVLDAVRRAGVPHLVHMSSVGAYSPVSRPGAREWATESWPTGGISTSSYSVDKAQAERLVDELESDTAVARVRPALILQPAAAREIGRYFLGRLLPDRLVRPALMRLVPWPAALRLQFVHADDVADGLLRVLTTRLTGGVNLASDEVVDRARFVELYDAITPPVPLSVVRAAAALSWRARLQPTDEGWIDLATRCPLLDTSRACGELRWTPARSSAQVLTEFVAALQHERSGPGPLLADRPHGATSR